MKSPEKFKITLEWTVEDVRDELDILHDEYNTNVELNTDECITILKNLKQKYDKIYGLKYVDIHYAIRELVQDRGDFETFDKAIEHLLNQPDKNV